VRDEGTLARIRALVIPPAWTDVWICRDAHGHLQATGRDARGRKVYRYHPDYRHARETDKYARLIRVGRALPRIRRQVARDLRRPGIPRDKVLALVVRLLELTHMRVGNEAYAEANRSFGLTTLRGRHATVTASGVRFRFRGKSGQPHELHLQDRRLARLVRRTQELPGQRLFEWLDEDGEVQQVSSEDVNEYLRRAAEDPDISARDFRTWAGTVLAMRALRRAGQPGTERERTRQVAGAVDEVAAQLGNTRTVARASYVHPGVIDAWEEGDLPPGRVRDPELPPTPAEERDLLRLLRAEATEHRRDPTRTSTPRRRVRSGRAGART
jgi:DNA topoisomerase-1